MTEQHKRSQGGWIQVNERLPLPFVDVLVVLDSLEGPAMDLGYRNRKGIWFYVGSDNGKILVTVTHWHPLPDLPGEVGKDQA